MATPVIASNISPGWRDYGSGFLTPSQSTSQIPDELLDAGRISLVQGQDYVDVLFNIVQADTSYEVFPGVIENLIDANPEKIFPTHITSKSTSGCRIVLNAQPSSINYILPWRLRPLSVTP